MAKKLLMIVAVAGLMSFIWLNAVNSADETQKPNNLQVQIPDGHLKIPHLWPGQNPPPQGRQNRC